ncbi:hypothetical protein [Bradyrhizobium japonicum]|uniref:hypothetical protein n=1 Tax=Bradyrhizobium japonicum TaxID=375 RepID=UPI0004626881|nr:hypothetical protein [Bradyrhizobium japonicum]
MRWFDPISERWIDPPRATVAPLTYADQQIIAANLREDHLRKASADRIWQAVIASAAASHVANAKDPTETCEIGRD